MSSLEAPKLPEVTECNPKMPSFSNSVTMTYSPDRGRYIIATKDIIPGEVIGNEKCYSYSLDLENMSSYCSNCLRHCPVPLPCPSCSTVVFCSEHCRAKAIQGDHRFECFTLPTLLAMGLKPVFAMVFKLLKNSSQTEWKETLEQMKKQECEYPPERLGFNQEGVHTPGSYESIYHLVTNKEKRPNGDLYIKCMIAFVLTMLLKQIDIYFLDKLGQFVSPTEEELLITGEMLFANLMKISCNGFQLVEFQCSGPPVTLERKTIGSAVFATLSLINHSCNPSASTYIMGRTQILRAARYISAGEEITESYCQTFYKQGPEERQMGLLEVYQFTCHCEACQRKWPVYQELPQTMQFKCIECSRSVSTEQPICRKCDTNYNRSDYEATKQELIDQWWSTAKKVKEIFEKSQHLPAKMRSCQPVTEEDLHVIRNAVELMDKYISSPCQPLWDVYDTLDLYFRLEGSPVFTSLQG
ncbi:hypothetical protein SK128_012848 [Halocaridina rubra]|uniref:Protein-lysine N-methyltransferase SMYD4 n=1 Tax=Halocaridina rubra TaxID=373956 RepID=A0AAN8X5J1_HALRR